MLRTFVCAAVALALCTGLALAGQKEKKKGQSVSGTVKKVDAATSTLTVTIKKKKETMDKEFKIGDTTKVVVFSGDEKKELTAKDGLKSDALKEGAKVTVVTDADGKVTEI
ncbi:MAG TPA: hypothetical protein VFA26_13225, partial [Gemmataceae bacterium]|nr:hypothetical protein [Gemmataceae bacterium]